MAMEVDSLAQPPLPFSSLATVVSLSFLLSITSHFTSILSPTTPMSRLNCQSTSSLSTRSLSIPVECDERCCPNPAERRDRRDISFGESG